MNTSSLKKKKGFSYCPSDYGRQWTTQEVKNKLPRFYIDNESLILRNYIHIFDYEQGQMFVIVDMANKTSFFQEYGS